MKNLRVDPVLAALTGCILLLVLVIVAETLLAPVPDELIVTADEPVAESENLETPRTQYVHPDLSRYSDALARPVFFASRKMPEPLPEEKPSPALPLRLKLEGVAISGDNRVAVLRDLGSNGLVQLSLGALHNGWRLDELNKTRVVFSRDGTRTELTLDPAL